MSHGIKLTLINRGGISWWIKRFITVWIPYIIVQLIAYWPFYKFELIPFLFDITLIKPLYHNGWYLQYLFIWYIVFFVIRTIPFLNKHRILIFAAISVMFFLTLREIKAEQSLSFVFGIFLSERKELQNKLFKAKYGILFSGFGIACLAIKQMSVIRTAPQLVMNVVQLGIKLPLGIGLMILCLMVVRRVRIVGTALGLVGIVSYELYLIHGYVLQIVPLSVGGVVLFMLITAALSIV